MSGHNEQIRNSYHYVADRPSCKSACKTAATAISLHSIEQNFYFVQSHISSQSPPSCGYRWHHGSRRVWGSQDWTK